MTPDLNDTCETVAESEVTRFGCFTTLPCRRSLAADICEDALARLSQDWTDRIGSSKTVREPGLENDFAGNCVLLALPCAIPERLWHVTYMAGLIFHLDDVAEILECRDAYHDLAAHAGQPLASVATTSGRQSSIVRDLLQPVADEMLTLDPVNAISLLSAWHEYFVTLGSRQKQSPSTIQEYILFRLDDFGCNHWLAMLRFSMGLHLSLEDMEQLDEVVHAAMVSVVLTNDWHSWPKELEAYKRGRGKLCNAVAVLMDIHDISAELARDMLQDLATTAEKTYVTLADKWMASDGSASEDALKYVEAVGALAAGTSVWSASCPRYNKHSVLQVKL